MNVLNKAFKTDSRNISSATKNVHEKSVSIFDEQLIPSFMNHNFIANTDDPASSMKEILPEINLVIALPIRSQCA
jgi:hypothetical protein